MSKKLYGRILSCVLGASLAVSLLSGCGKGDISDALGGAGLQEIYQPVMPTGIESSDIYVAPIEGISEDFIRGMDISSLLAEEASGVVYYDAEGNQQDLLKILADYGINYIRVRVWNDPFDKDGNGYGGGNCDAACAAEIGRRAALYGMKLNVDFHYSDFWADPGKQMCPKAWKGMNIDEKAAALYDYTVESLKTIIDAGADVGMVQIGNEINSGMAGETKDENVLKLLEQGSKAVRDISATYSKDIKIAVHYTNVDNAANIVKKATWLANNNLDYDIFGISYYSYWHGTLKNMSHVLSMTKAAINKDVMVLETSFPYTGEDSDCFGNSVSEDDITGNDYICSVQSQANATWDVMKQVSDVGGLGVFYWEGAWITVGDNYDNNMSLWKTYGSGWASEYSTDYDPDDAGLYYGGCSWDNQAFFDKDGNVLPSLGVFKYLKYGTETETKLEFLSSALVEMSQGQELVLPEGVYGVYNNRALSKVVPTVWNESDVAAVDTSVGGEYIVKGTTEDGDAAVCKVVVSYVNLLEDAGFEDGSSVWKVSYEGSTNPTDVQTKASDAKAGEKSFHWWDGAAAQSFSVEQTVTATEDGTYNGFAYIQGGDVGSDCVVKFYIKVNGEEVAEDTTSKLTGWKVWNNPTISGVEAKAGDTITVGMYVSCAAGGWGTMDDFCLYKD